MNFVSNTLKIVQDLVIPKSQNLKLLPVQIAVTPRIDTLARRGVVLTTVHFDDKAGCVAGKINDEMIDRYLPPEMEALLLQRAQKVPKLSFGVRRIATKLARAFISH